VTVETFAAILRHIYVWAANGESPRHPLPYT